MGQIEVITLAPIAFASNSRLTAEDDYWGEVQSTIKLIDSLENDCLKGIDTFSHLEIIYYFHKVKREKVIYGARHPRNDKAFPKVGIFAQRGKNRPNQLGIAAVKLIEVKQKEVVVAGLDCIDGTPILDIKPVMREFMPKGIMKQPDWTEQIMKHYWE